MPKGSSKARRREPQSQPHDALVKWTFSQRPHAMGLLKAVLPGALVKAVDWSTLKAEKASFVDRALRSRHGDLVLSARLGDERIYFYTLVEHQRDVEPLMVYRCGVYMIRLWEWLVRDAPQSKLLPPIVPLVIHHSKTGWTAAKAFQDIIAGKGPARQSIEHHVPHFEMRLIDLSEGQAGTMVEQALTGLGRLALWSLSVAGNDERLEREMGRFSKALDEVLQAPDGRAALEVLLRYLAATHAGMRTEQIGDLVVNAAGPPAQEVIVTILDEAKREGKREGKLEGKLEGKREGRVEMLLELLEARFGPLSADVKARVESAGDASLKAWAARMLSAPTLGDLFGQDGAPNAAAPQPSARKPSRRQVRAPARR